MTARTAGLYAHQEWLHGGQHAEFDIDPGYQRGQEHGRQDKGYAGGEQARPAGALIADMDHHFGRIGAGDQIGGADEVEKMFSGQPLAPRHGLIFEHGDVAGGPPEADDSQFSAKFDDFTNGSGSQFHSLITSSKPLFARGGASGCAWLAGVLPGTACAYHSLRLYGCIV